MLLFSLFRSQSFYLFSFGHPSAISEASRILLCFHCKPLDTLRWDRCISSMVISISIGVEDPLSFQIFVYHIFRDLLIFRFLTLFLCPIPASFLMSTIYSNEDLIIANEACGFCQGGLLFFRLDI